MILKTLSQVVIDPDQLDIPQGATANDTTLTAVLSIVFAVGAATALIFIIIAGIQFILSQGDPGKSTKARNAVLYAVIGLVLCMSAFSLVRFFVGRLA